MIHRLVEGGDLRPGLNIERVRDRGWAVVLYWRGQQYAYKARMRVFTKAWRWPRWSTGRLPIVSPRGVAAGGVCPFCGFYNAPESNVRDVDDGLVFCANCQQAWTVTS